MLSFYNKNELSSHPMHPPILTKQLVATVIKYSETWVQSDSCVASPKLNRDGLCSARGLGLRRTTASISEQI